METNQFNQFNRPPFIRPIGFDAFGKICPCCNGRFHPLNRKKKFCSPYCKHVWHYEKYKLDHKNDKLLEDANYGNYKVLQDFDRMGIHVVSERDLIIKGFEHSITPFYSMFGNKMCAIFNNYALHADGDHFKILKISEWKK